MQRSAGVILSLVMALLLAAVHPLAGHVRFSGGISRRTWLSVAGGASVAFVFLHLLPEMVRGQEAIESAVPMLFPGIHVWLVAFIGLAVFYGLERMALTSRSGHSSDESDGAGVFWTHAGSFAFYNALVGYLLIHREARTPGSTVLFGLAMALHFFVNDESLRGHFPTRYDRHGRWLLSAAVLVGHAIGMFYALSAAAISVILAFLGGAVILNVLKEELPEERKGRFWAFAAGAIAYIALLLALQAV
jgi:hypothetical protein